MKKVNKESKKRTITIVSLIIIILIAISIIGITYAWLTWNGSGTKTNVLKSGVLQLVLDDTTSNGITIDSAIPITDGDRYYLTPHTFKIKNTGTIAANYSISLVDNTVTHTRISDSYIKYELVVGSTVVGPKLLSSVSNRVIHSSSIGAGVTQDCSLRIWIDESATTAVSNQEFNAKLKITAQT